MSEIKEINKNSEESYNELNKELQIKYKDKRSNFDLNDQNELDYEEEVGHEEKINKLTKNDNRKQIENDDDDSDGEIISEKNNDDSDFDEGEPSPNSKCRKVSNKNNDVKVSEDGNHSEEEGEINDGEKIKKAFIPRVLCKYYQRGKCTWGRTCKFLHPGVNDTGNYMFLEFQDPTVKMYQQSSLTNLDTEQGSAKKHIETMNLKKLDESENTESAWERGLRHAKEMKEKAFRRKQMEKEQFEEKKMNLTLKEFENEKENDERYINVERMTNADDDLEDDEINQYTNNKKAQESRLHEYDRSINSKQYSSNNANKMGNTKHIARNYDSIHDKDKRIHQYSKQTQNRGRSRTPPSGRNNSNQRIRGDEWHDPWERKHDKKDTKARDYSSSDSDSGSRSRSRTSYSSSNSYKSRSSSYSSRSGSHSPVSKAQSKNPKVLKASKQVPDSKAANKLLPGRQVSNFSLKKVGKAKRSRSNSSASTYSSQSKTEDDNENDEYFSDSEIYSDTDEENNMNSPKKSTKLLKEKLKSDKLTIPSGKKRNAADLRNYESKKTKFSSSANKSTKPPEKDKKQMIKDQLKLIEDAIKKKKSVAKN